MHRRTAVVSLLALGLLAWFLRHANLAEVWGHVRTARVDYLLLALVFVAATYWVRAVRWQYLLAPIGPTRFRTAWRTTVIGFAALSLLPLRAGDLLRPYLLARQERLPASSVFATIVVERVLDLVTVLALLSVYVWTAAGRGGLPPSWRQPIVASAVVAAVAAAALLALMWLLAWQPARIGAAVIAVTRVLPRGLGARLGALAAAFSAGFAVARRPAALLLATCWSVPIWLLIAAEVWAVSAAFGIALPFTGAFLVQALLVIGVAVPTPAGLGAYHEAYRLGVTEFFGVANDLAVAAALVVHAVAFVPVVLAGMLLMAQDGLSLGRLRRLGGDGAVETPDETAPGAATRDKERRYSDEVSILRSSGR